MELIQYDYNIRANKIDSLSSLRKITQMTSLLQMSLPSIKTSIGLDASNFIITLNDNYILKTNYSQVTNPFRIGNSEKAFTAELTNIVLKNVYSKYITSTYLESNNILTSDIQITTLTSHSITSNTLFLSNNLNCNNLSLLTSNIYFNNMLCNTLITNTIDALNDTNIDNPNIIFGNDSTFTHLYGNSSINFNTNDQYYTKLIGLNSLSSSISIDNGLLSGVLINDENCFIKTDDQANRFMIKLPNETINNYILQLDQSNNLLISGTALLNNTTILSNFNLNNIVSTNLNVSKMSIIDSILNQSSTINTNLQIGKNIYASKFDSKNISIGNNLLIYNNLSIVSTLFISKTANLNNLIGYNLNASNLMVINLNVSSDLYAKTYNILQNQLNIRTSNEVGSCTINNNLNCYSLTSDVLTVNSNLYTSKDVTVNYLNTNNVIINKNYKLNQLTHNSTLNVSGNSFFKNAQIKYLNISNISILNNTFFQNLVITGQTYINNITMNTNLYASNCSFISTIVSNTATNNKIYYNNTILQTFIDNSYLAVYNQKLNINTNLSNILSNFKNSNSFSLNTSLYLNNYQNTSRLLVQSTINGNITINSNLTCNNFNIKSGTFNSNFNTNILKSNTMVVKGSFQNNIGTILNDLLVSGQDNYINQLYFSSISGPTTNLFYKTLNLGQPTSTINIQGQLNIINLFNTVYTNKTLNLNSNNPNDIGNNCGIVILANNNGYLKTNDTSTDFILRAPNTSRDNNIIKLDLNNNLYISGTSICTTVNNKKNIFISSLTQLNNSFIKNLIINRDGNFNNLGTNLLNITNATIFNNSTILSNFNHTSNSYFNNINIINTSLPLSNQLVSQQYLNTVINNYNLGVISLSGNISYASSIYISQNTILNSDVSFYSNLNISNVANLNNITIQQLTSQSILCNDIKIENLKMSMITNAITKDCTTQSLVSTNLNTNTLQTINLKVSNNINTNAITCNNLFLSKLINNNNYNNNLVAINAILPTVTILSKLTVSNTTILNNNLNSNNLINGKLYQTNDLSINTNIQGVQAFFNNITILGNLNILNTGYFNKNIINNAWFNTNLSVSGLCNINNIIINNDLMSNSCCAQNITTLSLTSGNLNVQNCIFQSTKYLNNTNLNIYKNLTVNSLFNISPINPINFYNESKIIGMTSLLSDLNIVNDGFIQGNSISTNSSLFVLNNSINIVPISLLSNLTINNYNSNALTINSNLTISAFTTLNSVIYNDLILSNLYATSLSNLYGNILINNFYTVQNQLNISGVNILNNFYGNTTTIYSNLYVTNTTNFQNIITNSITLLSNINISQLCILTNSTTMINNLYVTGFNNLSKLTCSSNLNVNNINVNNILYQKVTWVNSLYTSFNTILSNSIIQQNTTVNSNLYISNISILNNGTILSNLYVSGFSKLLNVISSNNMTSLNSLVQQPIAYNKFNNMFISSSISIFNSCNVNNLIINNPTTIFSSLYITNSSIFKDIIVSQANIIGSLYTSNVFGFNLNQCDYFTDLTALSLPVWSLFITKYDNKQTQNIINQLTLRINRILPKLTLIGRGVTLTTPYKLYVDQFGTYNDPGVTAKDYNNNNLNVFVTSIITPSINPTRTFTDISQISLAIATTYTIKYQATDIFENIAYIFRYINILSPLMTWNSDYIVYSTRQSIYTVIIPVFYSNYWGWPEPYASSGFGGSGISWGLSQTYLSIIDFSYNSSWCFILKIQVPYITTKDTFIELNFDSNLEGWNTSDRGQSTGLIRIYFRRNTYLSFSTNNRSVDLTFLNTGGYVVIYYNYDTKIIQFQLFDTNGNKFIDESTIWIYTKTGNTSFPFHIYNQEGSVIYNKGIYYDTKYVNYNTFASVF